MARGKVDTTRARNGCGVLRQDSFYKASVDIGEPVIAPLESERRTLLIEPKKVHQRRIPVGVLTAIRFSGVPGGGA
jgi:hypothetical protein